MLFWIRSINMNDRNVKKEAESDGWRFEDEMCYCSDCK